MEQTISADGNIKTFTDEFSGRCYREFKCAGCQKFIVEDDVIWAKPDGTLSTTHKDAKAYCIGCCPEEELDEKE